MDREKYLTLTSRFREMCALRPETILWCLGREKQNVFVCFPGLTQSYWLFIGTIDEVLSLSVSRLDVHLRHLERTRPMIWFPPSEWENGIGEAEIEEYHGRDIRKQNERKEVNECLPTTHHTTP